MKKEYVTLLIQKSFQAETMHKATREDSVEVMDNEDLEYYINEGFVIEDIKMTSVITDHGVGTIHILYTLSKEVPDSNNQSFADFARGIV